MEIRHRANKPDPLTATGDLVISGRAVCSKRCFGNQVAEMSFNRTLRLSNRQKIFIAQNFSRADRHHLDKTQDQIARGREFNQWNELVFVASTHQNCIQFDLIEARGYGNVDSLQNLRVQIAAGDLRVKVSIQCVERDVNRLYSSIAKSGRDGLPG